VNIRVNDHSGTQGVGFVKEYIPLANEDYAFQVKQMHQKALEKSRAELRSKILQAEARLRVLDRYCSLLALTYVMLTPASRKANQPRYCRFCNLSSARHASVYVDPLPLRPRLLPGSSRRTLRIRQSAQARSAARLMLHNPPSPSRVRWVQTDSKAVAARAKVLQYDIVADLHLTADFKGDRA
jgi:hypothetical protein